MSAATSTASTAIIAALRWNRANRLSRRTRAARNDRGSVKCIPGSKQSAKVEIFKKEKENVPNCADPFHPLSWTSSSQSLHSIFIEHLEGAELLNATRSPDDSSLIESLSTSCNIANIFPSTSVIRAGDTADFVAV